MVQDSESRRLDQYIVRLPNGMRERIKAAAERNNRSMNAEIVATLEDKYPLQEWVSLDRFKETHIIPIVAAFKNPKKRDQLITEARAFVEKNQPDVEVSFIDDDGKPRITFGYSMKSGFVKPKS